MKGNDVLKGLNHIDEKWIEEAATEELHQKNKKVVFKKVMIVSAAVAAVLVLVIGGKSIFYHLQGPKTVEVAKLASAKSSAINTTDDKETTTQEADSKETTTPENEYVLVFNNGSRPNTPQDKIFIEGHFWEDLTTDKFAAVFPTLYQKYKESSQVESTVHYSAENNIAKIFQVDSLLRFDASNSLRIRLAPGEISRCCILVGENEKTSELMGTTVVAGIVEAPEKEYRTYYADFKIDDIAYNLEFFSSKEQDALFTDFVVSIIKDGKTDLSPFSNPVIPELKDEKLSLAEAYKDPDFGEYLIHVPSRYEFESAQRFINQEENYLLASWCGNYQNILVLISKLSDDDINRVVNVSDTEKYDVSLYEIPYCDSVPEEIRLIFDCPIFKIDDLTVDVIKKRQRQWRERGEPETLHTGSFGVMFEGGIIVEIRDVKGFSADELYNEFRRIKNGI